MARHLDERTNPTMTAPRRVAPDGKVVRAVALLAALTLIGCGPVPAWPLADAEQAAIRKCYESGRIPKFNSWDGRLADCAPPSGANPCPAAGMGDWP